MENSTKNGRSSAGGQERVLGALTVAASAVLTALLMMLVLWSTRSVNSLAILPALAGLSVLVADHGSSILQKTALRDELGVVQYAVLVFFGGSGALALVIMGPE